MHHKGRFWGENMKARLENGPKKGLNWFFPHIAVGCSCSCWIYLVFSGWMKNFCGVTNERPANIYDHDIFPYCLLYSRNCFTISLQKSWTNPSLLRRKREKISFFPLIVCQIFGSIGLARLVVVWLQFCWILVLFLRKKCWFWRLKVACAAPIFTEMGP